MEMGTEREVMGGQKEGGGGGGYGAETNRERDREGGREVPASGRNPKRGSLQGLSASLGDSRYLLFPKTVFHPLC
jgi:hypothetical protein